MYTLIKASVFVIASVSIVSCGKNSGSSSSPRFSLDSTTPTYTFQVEGHSASFVTGTLKSAAGQRELSYTGGPTGNCNNVVAQSDWNLPPEAVMNSLGQVLVCWNHLTGEDSTLTLGPMPDPQNGVELLCRLYNADCSPAGDVINVGQSYLVAWLRNVTTQPDNTFIVELMYESGWFSTPTLPEHGTYQSVIDPKTNQVTEPLRKEAHCIL